MPPPATQLLLPLPLPQPGAERGDSLPDRLCTLLARRGRPLEVGHIASQLLRLRRCPERLQRRLVAEIVAGDPRLAWLGRDLVGLAPTDRFDTGIEEARFCVVDLETTGGSPGYSKVTEIGAVRVRGMEVVDRFSTLVDPGRPIPPAVTAITGIDDVMVAGRPDIETALTSFVAFAGDDVLVAHNAPFDLRFLNYERRRLAGRYFTQPWLDTLTLARRLLNGQVPRHDLRTLSEWAGTSVRPIHRALPDAEATAEVLVVLLRLLAERGHDTLRRAVAFGGQGGARHAYKLALAEDLPARPGVYLMRDGRGRVLYVGKAANLRRRVRAYFGPGGRHGRLIGRALEELERLEHEVCGSDFEALLRESGLIKELRPPCNRRGAATSGRYVRVAPEGIRVTSRVAGDGARYHGPVRSERMAREAVECLLLALPLEEGDAAARGAAVDEAERLMQGAPDALGRLGARLAAAAAVGLLGDDEQARARVGSLLALLAALARLRRALEHPAVVVEPSAREGEAVAFLIAGGRVRGRVPLPADGWRAPAREALRRLRRLGARPVAALDPAALDEALIVADRLRRRRPDPRAVRLRPGWRSAEALEAIGRAVRDACGGPAAVP